MTDARDDILGRLRRRRTAAGNVGDNDAAEAHLAARARGIQPARGRDRPVETFVTEATGVAASVDRVTGIADVPGAIAAYLAQHNLPSELRAAPALADLPWDTHPTLAVSFGRSDGQDAVGVTGALAGVAETGTLMLRSGADHPTTLNFLPDTHIVVLKASQIVPGYEDGWDLVRADMAIAGAMPRTVNFVTGPSRTGDIEQTIMLGAHGPRRLHIVLVEGE